MKFEGIDFNKEFYKGKSLDEFEKNEAHHGLSKEQMKEAHGLLQEKEKPAAAPPLSEKPATMVPDHSGGDAVKK